MVKFKALYKGMNDDLKDAEMMIDYACEISKHEEDKALADEIAKYAQYRLEHFMNFHKLFETEASKEKIVDKETVSECMWHETHEMFQHWYDDIERKIKKYSNYKRGGLYCSPLFYSQFTTSTFL